MNVNQLALPVVGDMQDMSSIPNVAGYYLQMARLQIAVEAVGGPKTRTTTEIEAAFRADHARITDYLAQRGEDDDVVAMAFGRAIELAGQAERNSAAVTAVLCAEAAKSGTFTAHPSGPKNFEEFLAAHMEGYEEGSTRARALSDLATIIVPMLEKHGLTAELLEALTKEGVWDKIIQGTWYLKALPTDKNGNLTKEGEEKAKQILRDVASPKVSSRKFREAHGPKKTTPDIVAYEVEEEGRSYVVIPVDKTTKALVKERLGKAEWRSGEGIHVGKPGA